MQMELSGRPETIEKYYAAKADIEKGMTVGDAVSKNEISKITFNKLKHEENGTTPIPRNTRPADKKHKIIDIPLQHELPQASDHKVTIVVCSMDQIKQVMENLK